MQVFIGSRYAYERYDMFGCIIDDLIEEYDLEEEYFDVGPMSREHTTTIGGRPVYGGTLYLLFDKHNSVSMDHFEMMDVAMVYGEVVQMWSGPFIIPKYMEVVDGDIDNLSEGTY